MDTPCVFIPFDVLKFFNKKKCTEKNCTFNSFELMTS